MPMQPNTMRQQVFTEEASCKVCSSLRSDSPLWYDKPLLETDHFFAIPSLGSLVPGWLLVLPKEHYLSVSRIDTPLRAELGGLLYEAADLIGGLFGPATVFEHGASHRGSKVGCGVDHAHVHVVPLPFSLAAVALEDPTTRWTHHAYGPHEVHGQSEDYLLVSEDLNSCLITHKTKPVSQYFRRLIASSLGTPDLYDYNTNHCLDNMRTTVERVREDQAVPTSLRPIFYTADPA
jgi:ATP adenylyltransferase